MLSRCRDDFQRNRSLSGSQQSDAVTIAHTQLDNLTAQVDHMRRMLAADMLVHTSGMVEWTRDEEAARRHEETARREAADRKRRLQEIRRQQRQIDREAQQSKQHSASGQQQQQQHEPNT